MKTIQLIALFLLVLPFYSCGTNKQVKGSGVIVKEQRHVSSFDKIEVSTAIHLILTQGTERSITVEADDNIVPLIQTEVKNNELTIQIKSPNTSTSPTVMNVYVTAPSLRALEANSAAKVSGESVWKFSELELEANSAAKITLGLQGDKLEVDVNSAASVELSGNAAFMEVDVSSAGKLRANDLIVKKAIVEVSSAGSAEVHVTDELGYDISSAGKLNYEGTPQILKAETDRSGKVHQRK